MQEMIDKYDPSKNSREDNKKNKRHAGALAQAHAHPHPSPSPSVEQAASGRAAPLRPTILPPLGSPPPSTDMLCLLRHPPMLSASSAI